MLRLLYRNLWIDCSLSLYIAFVTGFAFRQIRNGVDRSIEKKSLPRDFATRHRLFRRPPQQHRCTLHSTGKWRLARARLHWRSPGHIAEKLFFAWWVLEFLEQPFFAWRVTVPAPSFTWSKTDIRFVKWHIFDWQLQPYVNNCTAFFCIVFKFICQYIHKYTRTSPKMNARLGHRKTRRLSCEGVPKIVETTSMTITTT